MNLGQKLVAVVMLAVMSANASAQIANLFEPQSALPRSEWPSEPRLAPQGAWFAPESAGSGFYIAEIRSGGAKFWSLALFSHNATGTPVWSVANAPAVEWVPSDSDLLNNVRPVTARFDLLQTSNGSCLGCPYQAPTYQPSIFGRLDLHWITPSKAVTRLNGVQVQVSMPGGIAAAGGIREVLSRFDSVSVDYRMNGQTLSARTPLIGAWVRVSAPPEGIQTWTAAPQVNPAVRIPRENDTWYRFDPLDFYDRFTGTRVRIRPDQLPTIPARWMYVPASDSDEFADAYIIEDMRLINTTIENGVKTARILGATRLGRVFVESDESAAVVSAPAGAFLRIDQAYSVLRFR
jgi:hypothetical protein